MSTTATLDIEQREALRDYLRDSGRIGPDEQPTVRVLPGGVSNRTVLVRRPTGEAWVLKQALAKLRVQVDWFSSPERIHREALGLRWLAKLAPAGAITPLVFEDRAQHLLAMQAVPEPHENWKTMLLQGRLEPVHVRQFGRLLGAIHHQARARRAEIAPVFADRSFFESLRLEPYYGYAATRVPAAAPFLNELLAETRRQQDTLAHGDYSPKNILVHQDRLVLLDHEVIHWGDPGFDLGFSLTHFLSKAHHLPAHRTAFADAARLYWQTYRATLVVARASRPFAGWTNERGSRSTINTLEPRVVRHTLGCLLARVAGRSPLEYLDETERRRQCDAVLRLMKSPPATVPELVEDFRACL